MKVADTSFLVEGILRDASLLENETFLAPDLALYEVANALWKHETLIRDLKDSSIRVDIFLELVSNQIIELLRPDRKLLNETYRLSMRYKTTVYDAVFVALALQLGLELKTFDERQSMILSKERKVHDR
jgi:predicted nucleic acid-binding protein